MLTDISFIVFRCPFFYFYYTAHTKTVWILKYFTTLPNYWYCQLLDIKLCAHVCFLIFMLATDDNGSNCHPTIIIVCSLFLCFCQNKILIIIIVTHINNWIYSKRKFLASAPSNIQFLIARKVIRHHVLTFKQLFFFFSIFCSSINFLCQNLFY